MDPAGLGTDLLASVWVEEIVVNAGAAGVVGNGPGPTGFFVVEQWFGTQAVRQNPRGMF